MVIPEMGVNITRRTRGIVALIVGKDPIFPKPVADSTSSRRITVV